MEVMIAVLLIAVAAAVVYTEMILSYRVLMRSRARMEANGLAFDYLWKAFNMPKDDLPAISQMWSFATPENTVFSTNGMVDLIIHPEVDAPLLPDSIQWWDITVQVWPSAPGVESPLQLGTNELARCVIRRYRGER